MKVILTKDVKSQGKKGDVINVSDGYATNYLFKNNLAVPASSGNISVNNARKAAEQAKIDQETAQAKMTAKQLEQVTVNVSLPVGANGKAFGSVSAGMIGEELAKIGLDIDRKKIEVDNIKTVGNFTATIKLYKGVSAKVKVVVSAK